MCPKHAGSPMGLENPREEQFFFLVMPTHFPRSWAALESQGSILVHQIPQLGAGNEPGGREGMDRAAPSPKGPRGSLKVLLRDLRRARLFPAAGGKGGSASTAFPAISSQ